MKHAFRKMFIPLVSLFGVLMTSCGGQSSGGGGSDIPTIDFDPKDFVSHGSSSGYLIDISADSLLSENNSYLCSFNPSTSSSGKIKITSSREESVTCETKDNGPEFTLFTHAVGDSILKIYDVDDILVYRYIVRVRKAFTQAEIVKECFNNDVYRGVKILGNHRMTFLNDATVPTAQVKGSDDFEENLDLSFTCTYSQYIQEMDSYEFTCEITDNPNNSQTRITVIYVSRTASEIKVYYASGSENSLLNIFYASKYAYLYEGLLY